MSSTNIHVLLPFYLFLKNKEDLRLFILDTVSPFGFLRHSYCLCSIVFAGSYATFNFLNKVTVNAKIIHPSSSVNLHKCLPIFGLSIFSWLIILSNSYNHCNLNYGVTS